MATLDEAALQGLYDNSTLQQRQMTLQYFEQLKGSPDGWKLCANIFTHRLHSDERVKFFCLQVMENHIRCGHASSSDDDILALRELLLTWMKQCDVPFAEKVYIKNKMAHIFALTFVIDYPHKWPMFFSDVLGSIQSGQQWCVDLYLRVLLAIDSEVVDRSIIHTQEENTRNTLIKDTMRVQCVCDLVESWFQIMTAFEQLDHTIVALTCKVVGAYIAWIEIALIANDRFVGLLLKYLSVVTVRESAAECLHEIVSKGMNPLAKTKLVESLCKVLETVGVLSPSPSQVEDIEFQIRLSALVCAMGCSLVSSWSKLVKSGETESAKAVLAAVETKVPYLHRYLCDEDDGVSEAIIEFAVMYVSTLKQCANLSDNDRVNLQALLAAVIQKLKYDASYNFDAEGDDEAMFLQYRKQLKVLFDNIALLDPGLVLQTSQGLLTSVLSNWHSEPFMNVEVVLRVFYMLGEVIIDKQEAVNVPGSVLHQMMTTVLQSQVYKYPHTVVLLQYYEILVRYEKYFAKESQFVAGVVESFLGECGLRHESCAVRSRLCYFFVRLVKSLKNQVAPVAEEILKNLQELLVMLPGSPENSNYLSGNDLLFLYEAAGVLVVASQQPPEGKRTLMNFVLAPAVEKFPLYLSQLANTTEPLQQEEIAQAVHCLLSFASRASKVYTNHQQVLQSGCLECFAEPLPMFLHGLEVSVQQELLHSGVRQYLHRMIICLGDELLKYVPMAVSLLLKDCKAHDIREFIPLINQLISKYKAKISTILQEIFMPVCQTINICLNEPFDPSDQEEQRERQHLQKAYFLFISSVTGNGLANIIAQQNSQSMQEVLGSVIQGALVFPDPAVQKVCFGILKNLVEAWALPGAAAAAAATAATAAAAAAAAAVAGESSPGFVEFMYKHIIPACFLAPLRSTFDFGDAHSFLALGEIAAVLKAVVKCRGEEAKLYLQNTYLPSLNLSPQISQELLAKIEKAEARSLKSYLKVFFIQLRT